MKLVRVETELYRDNEISCTYECSDCGTVLRSQGGKAYPYCPGCGRKLDTAGKPFSFNNVSKDAVALAFLAIRAGLLKDGMPSVASRGKGAELTYVLENRGNCQGGGAV